MSYSLSIQPKCYTLSVAPATTTTVSFNTTAVSLMLTNNSSTSVPIVFNGDPTNASATLPANTSLVWGANEMHITSLAFNNTQSGAGGVLISIIAGVVNI